MNTGASSYKNNSIAPISLSVLVTAPSKFDFETSRGLPHDFLTTA